MLFGGVGLGPGPEGAGRPRYPYLEIVDPTSGTRYTTMSLNKSVFRGATMYSTFNVRVQSGAGLGNCSPTENERIPFVSDPSRGIICAEVYCYTEEKPCSGSHEFVLDIEDMLSNVPSPLNPRRRHVKWKDLSSSTAVFSYGSRRANPDITERYRVDDLRRLQSGFSCVAGFRYASQTQPIDPNNQTGLWCFFVYDFNPHRGSPDLPPGDTLQDPDPKWGYIKSASEITREVVGGLSRWKMRFDLTPGENFEGCEVTLTDHGVVLFNVRCLTIFSKRFKLTCFFESDTSQPLRFSRSADPSEGWVDESFR